MPSWLLYVINFIFILPIISFLIIPIHFNFAKDEFHQIRDGNHLMYSVHLVNWYNQGGASTNFDSILLLRACRYLDTQIS